MQRRSAHEPEEDEGATLFEHAIFAPPWRDFLGFDGETGAALYSDWYGPTLATFEQQLVDYELRPFWDPEESERSRRGRVLHWGRDHVQGYMRQYATRVPDAERRVYYAFFVDGLSYRASASRLRMQVGTVKHLVHRLRTRANATRR